MVGEYLLVILHAVVCYYAIILLPHNWLQLGILILSLGYLNSYLLHRQLTIDPRIYKVDIAGPLMIATEKVTSLAFGLADGRKTGSMSSLRKRFVVKRVPTALEFFSYLLCFQGLVAGPLFFYTDYISYIQGNDKKEAIGEIRNYIREKTDNQQPSVPSPVKSVLKKLLAAIFWIVIHISFQEYFPCDLNADAEFIQAHSIFYRTFYLMVSFVGYKAKFYLAFLLGEAVCNASGLGFSSYNSDGQAQWDLVTNVKPLEVEFGLNPKTAVENWNIQTTLWLRQVCYDRVTTFRRQKTFLLSSVWHGCYPGYWIAFLAPGVLSGTFNMMRKKFRPYFLNSREIKILYDIITWALTQFTIAYYMIPFSFLNLKPSLDFFVGMSWWYHIVCVIIAITLPFVPTPETDENGYLVKRSTKNGQQTGQTLTSLKKDL